MSEIINSINNVIWSVYVLVPLLLIAATYFAIRTRVVHIRMIPHTVKLLMNSNSSNEENNVSSFQAFIIGLGSRVGTGNLAGVAIALVSGGPGAIFWMWIASIFGAICAFVESTLGQIYKEEDAETKYRGGPAYYITKGLNNRILAVVFSVIFIAILCIGIISIQANTITKSLANVITPILSIDQTNIEIIIGLLLAGISGYIIWGGARKIVNILTIVVSAMAALYIFMALFVMLTHLTILPEVFSLIIESAFNPSSVAAGTLGAIISTGFKRGLFSNEAGFGTAPNAAASADVKHPVVQGLIQSLGALIDTVIICSLTAFIILISGIPLTGTEGITITQQAMQATMGDISVVILTLSVVCFAFSTILGYFFYAQTNVEFLFKSEKALKIYKIVIMLIIFIGSVTNSAILWSFADLGNGLAALINIFVILKLSKYVFIALKDYQKQLAQGIEEPIFDAREYPEFNELKIWHQDKNKID